MSKIIKLNESSLKRLFEYVGDEEEFGRYDINPDDYNMSDEEYENLQQQLAANDELYDNDIKELADEQEAEQWIGRDYYDPGDGDLYRGW